MRELLLSPVGVLCLYLLAVNAVTFLLYGIDKRKAQKGKWRIPERTLLILPLFGGSVGGILGMQMFRHKTKHWYFRFGLPAMLVLHLALAVYFIWFR